jgi:hypothetical protein
MTTHTRNYKNFWIGCIGIKTFPSKKKTESKKTMSFSGLFGGKQKTPQELLREHQRTLRKAMREMDRERNALIRQEKQLTLEIRKMARANQMVI